MKLHHGGHEIGGMIGKQLTGKGTQEDSDPSPIPMPSSPTVLLLQGQVCTHPTCLAYTCNDKFPFSSHSPSPGGSIPHVHVLLPLLPSTGCSCSYPTTQACPSLCSAQLQGPILHCNLELCSPIPASGIPKAPRKSRTDPSAAVSLSWDLQQGLGDEL